MMNTCLCSLLFAAVTAAVCPVVHAQATPPSPISIAEFASPAGEKLVTPSSAQVSFTQDQGGIAVTVQTGADGYPGITLKPAKGVWDLSSFGRVEARITNTGAKAMTVCLRVDDDGDWQKNPWNAENLHLQAGQTGTALVRFGYSFGKPGYALKSSAIAKLLVFTGKGDALQSFRIESIQAAGTPGEKPPVDPASIRTKPAGGVLLGQGVTIDAKQLTGRGVQAAVIEEAGRPGIQATFASAMPDQFVQFKPATGRWDLRDYLEVRASVRNAGTTPIQPRMRIDTNRAPSDWASLDKPLAPGETAQITASFISKSISQAKKGTGNEAANDAVAGITVSCDTPGTLVVDAITAGLPEQKLPDWLGKRPPVEGNWAMTFSDEFSGASIDSTKWNIYGENYWDKASHFSKDNTIIGGGVVRLRFEKKHGHQNDDPNHKLVTDYATGFLDTYGKFTQTYGYFEARMKLPKAPGLWPAFWMMPDRGVAAGEQWKRADTGNGGMEFDIMEHLTRWGNNRYNLAMHWDGYGKDHKSTGSEIIYVQPDKDGFITAGLLWQPGLLVFYGNGQEVMRYENPRVSSVPGDLMFTLPMGGWDNSPLDDAQLPDDFVIDYVRVWQKQ